MSNCAVLPECKKKSATRADTTICGIFCKVHRCVYWKQWHIRNKLFEYLARLPKRKSTPVFCVLIERTTLVENWARPALKYDVRDLGRLWLAWKLKTIRSWSHKWNRWICFCENVQFFFSKLYCTVRQACFFYELIFFPSLNSWDLLVA